MPVPTTSKISQQHLRGPGDLFIHHVLQHLSFKEEDNGEEILAQEAREAGNVVKKSYFREVARVSRQLAKLYGGKRVLIEDIMRQILAKSEGKITYLLEASRYEIRGKERQLLKLIKDSKNYLEFSRSIRQSKSISITNGGLSVRSFNSAENQSDQKGVMIQMTKPQWKRLKQQLQADQQLGARRMDSPSARGKLVDLYLSDRKRRK